MFDLLDEIANLGVLELVRGLEVVEKLLGPLALRRQVEDLVVIEVDHAVVLDPIFRGLDLDLLHVGEGLLLGNRTLVDRLGHSKTIGLCS